MWKKNAYFNMNSTKNYCLGDYDKFTVYLAEYDKDELQYLLIKQDGFLRGQCKVNNLNKHMRVSEYNSPLTNAFLTAYFRASSLGLIKG